MSRFKKGDFILLDGRPAVVVGIEGDENVPEAHVALWFGEPNATRTSEGELIIFRRKFGQFQKNIVHSDKSQSINIDIILR
jgi:hypothetical protein